ncbi:hypothetical protein HY969_03980 [Candidatus Kaiserbacteria bacterium]|nr:hypothetical protein [Candidatus Kaiserbacteria bacterium]
MRKIDIREIQDPHRQYWRLLFRKINETFFGDFRTRAYSIVVVALVLLVIFGLAIPKSEFSVAGFTFELPWLNSPSKHKTFDRSIFSVAWEVSHGQITAEEQNDIIARISGLETKAANGTVISIWREDRSLTIEGLGDDPNQSGSIRCDFPASSFDVFITSLKQGDYVGFKGTISHFDPSRQRIVLKDCYFLG